MFQRSLWILLLGPWVPRTLIYGEGGDIGSIVTVVLLVELLLLLLFGGRRNAWRVWVEGCDTARDR